MSREHEQNAYKEIDRLLARIKHLRSGLEIIALSRPWTHQQLADRRKEWARETLAHDSEKK